MHYSCMGESHACGLDLQIWTNCLLTHDENLIQFPQKYFQKPIMLTCVLTESKHTKIITF